MRPRSITSGVCVRRIFGLASLFGVNYAGKVEGPMKNSYLSLNKDSSGQFHPLLKDFENAVRIINAANQVAVTPAGEGIYPLQVVPHIRIFRWRRSSLAKDAPAGQPGAIVRQVGKGRVVYLPGDIDRTFWETLSFDQARLLRNAVLWATDEPAPWPWRARVCLTSPCGHKRNP